MIEPELALPAGDVTQGVVRVGRTVRRPHQPQSWAIAAYLDHLESAGFDGAPRFLGLDDRGRDVLTYLEGDVAGSDIEPWVLEDSLLVSVATLVRRLHDASAGYDPTAEPFPARYGPIDSPQLVTHLDVTPQNVITRDGVAVALIDFDLARPTTRLRDSFNTAMHWVPLQDPVDLQPAHAGIDQFSRLRLFADAYGWTISERRGIPAFGADHADASWTRMKHNAETVGGGWARMWSEGVGDVIRRRGAWLRLRADEIVAALID